MPGDGRLRRAGVRGDVATQADFIKCGGGQLERCCAFLGAGANGIECLRADDRALEMILDRVRAPDWSAKRVPRERYPMCQSPESQQYPVPA